MLIIITLYGCIISFVNVFTMPHEYYVHRESDAAFSFDGTLILCLEGE